MQLSPIQTVSKVHVSTLSIITTFLDRRCNDGIKLPLYVAAICRGWGEEVQTSRLPYTASPVSTPVFLAFYLKPFFDCKISELYCIIHTPPRARPQCIQIPTLLELPPSVTLPLPFHPGSHPWFSHSLQKFSCSRNVSDNNDYSFEYVDCLVIQHGFIIFPHFIDKD